MTYVDQNEAGVALEAAKFLDRLMSGEANAARTIIVPTGDVVALGSTDTVAVEDRKWRTRWNLSAHTLPNRSTSRT